MRYAAPHRLAHVVPPGLPRDPVVYLMPLPDGPPVVLTGSAALIWLAAAAGVDDVVADVAGAVGSDANSITADIKVYLDNLVDSGLLDTVDQSPGDGQVHPEPESPYGPLV